MDFNAQLQEMFSKLPVGLLVALGVVSVAIGIVGIIATAKIYKKAGKPGWHVIIPFLNSYDLFEISWSKGILFLLLLIPVVNLVIQLMMLIKLARAFGKGGGFAAGLFFLPWIFILILGFGSAAYIGPDGVPENRVHPPV